MKVGLTQMDIVWEDKEKNMEKARKLVEQAAKQDVELLVFPEMTFTGFTMNTALAGEEMLFSPTLRFFKENSRKYHMSMAFGFVEDFGGYGNIRFCMLRPAFSRNFSGCIGTS